MSKPPEDYTDPAYTAHDDGRPEGGPSFADALRDFLDDFYKYPGISSEEVIEGLETEIEQIRQQMKSGA